MKHNCQNLTQVKVEPIKVKTYPYLFNMNDNNQPYGYENSGPKQNYIYNQQMESQKRIPLQNGI
jgi:hypothetical protein